jgi:hypothetical protein
LKDTQEGFAAMKQLLVAFLFVLFSLPAQAQNRGLPDFTELVEKQGAGGGQHQHDPVGPQQWSGCPAFPVR